ncbi:hypothetical protein [Pararhizobium qamdonense]|uniref:hypothetical protein n=1 Tax=Pararhizobium qamdonense TaxID=3031126 RepID=UPI0023E2C6D5|nr:hypothetical protein [Pararhizobium qamdonense]
MAVRRVYNRRQKLYALPPDQMGFFDKQLNRVIDRLFELDLSLGIPRVLGRRVYHAEYLTSDRKRDLVEIATDGSGARLPIRRPREETGKIPMFAISVMSG